jgi:hypothetical protein
MVTLIREKIAVIAVRAVVGHAIVGAVATVVHVALGGTAELLGTVEA